MQLQQRSNELTRRGVEVLIVTFETPTQARDYMLETGCTWPVVSDQTRHLFYMYGMRRAKLRHLWGWATVKAYFGEARRGYWPRWPVSDTKQQGGDVLIDPDGMIDFVHVGLGPADRPSVGDILSRVGNGDKTSNTIRL